MLLVFVFLFVMGMVWGSFLNVVIWRMSHGSSPIEGRSKCPKCKKLIPWYMNIPVLSFVFLRGKCAFCGKKISIQYPLVELLTGAFFVWWFVVGFNFFKLVGSPWSYIQPIFWLIVGLIMFVIFLTDLLYMVIPFGLNLTLFTFALAYRIGLTSFGIMNAGDFGSSIVVAVVVTVSFLAMRGIVKVWRRVDGFGLGDIYLAPSLGLLLGWPRILPGIFIAFLLGALVGVCLLVTRKKSFGEQIPFGPFLVLGSAAALLWGNPIWSWYLGFLV